MTGNPADLTIYKYDTADWRTKDASYYGRGCTNGWGSGSKTPCSDSESGGRIVKERNGEEQKNGTYYHFQAATAGAGGSISTDNTNSPDTFCPLGWQLPYSGTGGNYYDKSKSWRYLFTTYNIGFNPGSSEEAPMIRSYPFSIVYSGTFNWGDGLLYRQTGGGYYWSSTIISDGTAYGLTMDLAGMNVSYTYVKMIGHNVRCSLLF